MKQSLRIVMIASECVPFAKTGGLADVVGALPQALHALGHEVIVVMPKYRAIADKHSLSPFHSPMGVWMGESEEWCAVHTASLGKVPVYFIESDKYFDRDGFYHDANYNDYADNPRRFGFLTRAALQLCRDIGFSADIVHAHDWQAALAPAYLKVWHWDDPILGGTASVLTIHNIGYQGRYNAEHYPYLGLGWDNFTAEKFEDYGSINFLKGGIHYADLVNTVRPTYAHETRTPEHGFGLAPFLNNKNENYTGILNGVDYTQWDPTIDPLIPARYSADDLSGKAICKEALQQHLQLDVDRHTPVIGVISRLVDQKGLDLLAAVIEQLVNNLAVQFAILGSGDKKLETFFHDIAGRYRGRIGSHIGYSNELAHLIEAGADFFAMPSRYEPCGLNQIYSLRYGTLPIVRATGGLHDTVEQYVQETAAGTGFKFWATTPAALSDTIGWAVATYHDRPEHMTKLIQRAMSRRFSWQESAREYVTNYRRAIQNKQAQ